MVGEGWGEGEWIREDAPTTEERPERSSRWEEWGRFMLEFFFNMPSCVEGLRFVESVQNILKKIDESSFVERALQRLLHKFLGR